jgi:hypothetical protein
VGLFDRILRREPEPETGRGIEDAQALQRYRYLLRTAPPEAIEQVHAEAFAQLTPQQRQQVLRELSAQVPEHERARSDDPRSLARMATRAELRQPGILERTFGNMGGGYGGPGFGSIFASSLLGSIAGYVIGSAIADQFFADAGAYADAAGHDPADFSPETVATDEGFDPGGLDGGFDLSDI